ncbi:RloB domain-containing protein [Fibrella sp. HMF5335]|uniref:RloB domain-containing protein n=1 Tax=Fibrella rubiginis TaxID=2817060 RepID=A0A939K591_9BACT|nr:RloB family protein [Fibrella rubiginis]MBO0939234.1 RloB domain-containing protein [Fibrella rubiginis]
MKSRQKSIREAEERDEKRAAKRAKRAAALAIDRAEPTATEFIRLLVVTEGVNTEVSYFRQFQMPNVQVRTVGTGYNTLSLVRRAEQVRDEERLKGSEYDQVWCVFDRDDFDAEDFNEAVRLAQHLFGDGRVAYSNQSFEYWLLLHFLDHQGGAMHRQQYDARLNECLAPYGVQYEGRKSKRISTDFFDLMLAIDPQTRRRRIDQAITRAERVFDQYDHRSPAIEESSTTVFRVVKEIMGDRE